MLLTDTEKPLGKAKAVCSFQLYPEIEPVNVHFLPPWPLSSTLFFGRRVRLQCVLPSSLYVSGVQDMAVTGL